MAEIEIRYHEYKKKDISNSMVIISYPTVGIVSTIVANFIVDQLKLERIGAFISNDFFPAAVVENGLPIPPMRVYAGEAVCGMEKSCDQLIIITSELPMGVELMPSLADKIIDWCIENRCKMLMVIEGIHSHESSDEKPKLFHVGSNKIVNESLDYLGTTPLNSGIVSGLSGLLLYKGNIKNFTVGCILASAHSQYPDSRTAASVVSALMKIIPNIDIDPEPLMKQAEEIESQIKKAWSQIQKLRKNETPDEPSLMYR